MRLIRLSLIFVLLASFGLINFSTQQASYAQSADSAPYLFYYSYFYDSFIVERADGSESYQIWGDLMDPSQFLIKEIGWSPTGEWYAWQSAERTEEEVSLREYPTRLWLVNRQGERIDAWDDETQLFQVEWSPTQDILLITTTDWSQHVPPVYQTYLYDVANQTLLYELETEMPDSVQWASWAPDGEHFMLYRTSWSTGDIWEVRIVSLDGTMDIRDWSDMDVDNMRWLPDGRLTWLTDDRQVLHIETIGGDTETINSDGLYETISFDTEHQRVYLRTADDNAIMLYNLETNEIQKFEHNLGNIRSLSWSADGQLALFAVHVDEDQPNLAILDIAQGTFTQLNIPSDEQPDLSYVKISWVDNNNRVIFSTSAMIYAYDFTTETFTELTETTPRSSEVSSDGVTLLHSGCVKRNSYEGDFPPCLTNLVTNETIVLPIHSGTSQNRFSELETDWSVDNEWLILTEFTNVGGSYYPYYSVVKHDGTQHRDLTDHTNIISWITSPEQLSFLYGQGIPLDKSLPNLSINSTTPTHAIAWHPFGPILAGGFTEQEVVLFDTGAGQPFLTVHEPTASESYIPPMRGLTWLPDDRLIGVSGTDMHGYTVYVWDGSNTVEPLLDEFPVEAEWDEIDGEAYLSMSTEWPDEPYAPIIKVDLTNRRAAAQFLVDPPSAVAITADEIISLIAIDDEPVVLRVEDYDRQVLREVTLADTSRYFYYTSLAASSDGKLLAGTGTLAGELRIWDTTTGEVVGRYYVSGRNLAFSPDDTQIVVAASSQIIIWDVPSR